MSEFSDWQLLDDGSWNGLRKWVRSSDADEGMVQVKYEDVGSDAILEQNKQMEGPDKRQDMWLVGRIPAALGLKWLVEEGIDMWNPHHSDAIKRKLMDSDYRYLVPGMQRIIF